MTTTNIILLIGFAAYWAVAVRLFVLSVNNPELDDVDAPYWMKITGPALYSIFWIFGFIYFMVFEANTEVDDV